MEKNIAYKKYVDTLFYRPKKDKQIHFCLKAITQ